MIPPCHGTAESIYHIVHFILVQKLHFDCFAAAAVIVGLEGGAVRKGKVKSKSERGRSACREADGETDFIHIAG